MDHRDIDKAEIRLECLKLANHNQTGAEILVRARAFIKFVFDEEGAAEVAGITGTGDKKPARRLDR